MSRIPKPFRLGLLLLGLLVLMTGCLGLFSSKVPTTPPQPTLVQGTLSGPSGLLDGATAQAASASISGEVPLARVPVAVYALSEYLKAPGSAQALRVGTTDGAGKFTVTEVPEGVNLILVAATTPRLSAIVPAGGRELSADVNSATTLVAEAWAETLDENHPVSAAELAAAVGKARQALDALQLDADALLDALEDLIPSSFGAGLSATPPPGFDDLIQVLKSSAPGYEDPTYSLSGTVRDQYGVLVSGITIAFSDGYGMVTSDQVGRWSMDGLEGQVTLNALDAEGWFTVITPPLTVSGETHEIEIVGYAGVVSEPYPAAVPYEVSGRVTLSDGTPLEGVKLEAKFASQQAQTDAAGEFLLAGLEFLAVIVPEAQGYRFSPTERTIGRTTHDIHFVGIPVGSELSFEDPQVERAVREYLNLSPGEPILEEETEEVFSLELWDGGIFSLAGLEHLVNLKSLSLFGENPELESLSPLAALQSLEVVHIKNSSVSDLAPLTDKRLLTDLLIVGSNVSDISPLATLLNLEHLVLQWSPISDASPLAGLSKMASLDLRGLTITTVPPTQGMTSLRELSLMGNHALTNVDALVDTTARSINLEDTPALDWCSWEATWSIVDTLRQSAVNVEVDPDPCQGPFTLFGTVEIDAGAPYTPEVDVVLTGSLSSDDVWVVQPDANGYWEQTVEGRVTIRYRVTDDESTVWRFNPVGYNNLDRPVGDLETLVYPATQPIIEGYVLGEHGQPLGVNTVKMTSQTSGTTTEVPVDENGYFTHQFVSHGSYHVVPISDIDLIPSVPMPVSTPVRVNFYPTDVAPLDVAIDAATEIIAGTDRTISVFVDGDYPDADAIVEWEFDGGTILGPGNRTGQIEWQAPDTVGTVTATVHVTIGSRSGTDQFEITIVEPFTGWLEADRYVVDPGEKVALTASFTGHHSEDGFVMNWEADFGTIEFVSSLEGEWTAPNFSGTFTIRMRGRTSPIQYSDWVEIEIEVRPDALCEGAMHCGVIRTLDQLQAMEENPKAHHILANDIDASPTRTEWGPNGFRPVGSADEPFTGTFDGQDHTIEGLYIRTSGQGGIGLFGVAGEGAKIANVRIEDADVAGSRPQFGGSAATGILLGTTVGAVEIENVHTTGLLKVTRVQGGGLVGFLDNGSVIVQSSSTATIDGSEGSNVGGLVGAMSNGSLIDDSYATGDVLGTGTIGGLVGAVWFDSVVVRSWSSGSVTGSGDEVGGLVGDLWHSLIIETHSTGDVAGAGDVGGLVGAMRYSAVYDSYNEGNVYGTGRQVGGLVGWVYGGEESRIENAWSSGDVEGEGDFVGGFVGANGGFIGFENTGGATILNSRSTGNVKGVAAVGGFAGRHTQGGLIELSSAEGDVVASGNRVGGFVGHMGDRSPTILDSAASGEVRGANYVGGFAGRIDVTSTIEGSSASGIVSGTGEYVGSFIGYDANNPPD